MNTPAETIGFRKFHGTGNDFIVVRAGEIPPEQPWIGAICDRHRGVGGDGVLVVETRDEHLPEGLHAFMSIYNRDGSRPEMCGNGIRCVSRYLVETCGFDGEELRVGTDAGLRVCRVDASASPWQITVDMGAPRTSAEPVTISFEGRTLIGHPVDMGNPHVVVFDRAELPFIDRVGEWLNSGNADFPNGVNLEMTHVEDDESLTVTVFERGVGRTEACGTGACAAAVAAREADLVRAGATRVRLPGGELLIEIEQDSVWMTGPAEAVYDGELRSDWIQSRRPE